ncbi:MAG: hypothetical protein KDK05_25425, partial [Candidatus Competibacteraceae bacterium]|nr:hypothetical protein [Candidatus Competibacteraceae bacterium]
ISIISKLIAGDISFVAALTNATHLQIESCDAELDVAALQNNTALERLFLNNTLAYGDGGAAFAPLVNLLTLQYHTTDVATDISELATLTKLTNLRINDTPATGDIVSLYVLSDLTAIIVSRTDIGCSSGVMNWPAIRSISLDNSWTQPEVDAFVNALYILWVSGLTYATPTCYIGGSNAAPSGTYQAANPPTTPLEKIYTMVNDNTSTGNNTFSSFTYTTP